MRRVLSIIILTLSMFFSVSGASVAIELIELDDRATLTKLKDLDGDKLNFGNTKPLGGFLFQSLGGLNDTGITWGGLYPSGNNLNCSGSVISAQDCRHGRDALAMSGRLVKAGDGVAGFDFTKLSAKGTILKSDAPQWACVRDNVTKLVWHTEVYLSTCEQWDKFINAANNQALCGFTDWQVPNRESLRSIIHYGKTKPIIDVTHFPSTPPSAFWSASKVSGSPKFAWSLNFDYGHDHIMPCNNSLWIRLVRGEQ